MEYFTILHKYAWKKSYLIQNSQLVSGDYWLDKKCIRLKVIPSMTVVHRNAITLQVASSLDKSSKNLAALVIVNCEGCDRKVQDRVKWQPYTNIIGTRSGKVKCLSMSKGLTFTGRFLKIWLNPQQQELSFRYAALLLFVSCCSQNWSGSYHQTSEVNCT